jgi:eukaryotic-like serine/threonine-protein kinase
MATCPKCRGQFPDDVKFCPTDGEKLLSDEAFSGSDSDLAAGVLVGEYQVEKKIGEGGFGAVYLAVHPLIGKRVAVKVLSREYSSNPQMVQRFIEEARAVNQIRHRNIIDIFSFGVLDDKRQYFVMEYLDGKPLDVVLREKGRLRPEEAIPLLRQVARALDAAHAAGIAHRDLKPENVFVSYDDDGNAFPKLLDFGIAKLLGESQRSGQHRTRTGQPIGTPYYMSPEQCLGKSVDHRTDIYSFGVMCHELLTGKLPFWAEELMNVLVMQMTQPPPRMSAMCPEIPAPLDEPVLRMLAKQPENRPPGVASGLEALAQAARDAGFAVEVHTRRSGMSTPGVLPPVPGGAKLTPAEQAAIGAAQTMPIGSAPAGLATKLSGMATPGASAVTAGNGLETLPRPAAKGRAKLLGAVGAVIVVGAIAGGLALRGSGGNDKTAPGPGVSAPASTMAAAPPSGAATAAASASSTASAAAPSDEVSVTIQSTPPGVDVYLGDGAEKLGTAPGPIHLKRGDKPLTLTFKAAGYAPDRVEVTPSGDVLVPVKLDRSASSGGKGPRPGGTETAKPPPKGTSDVVF